MVKWAEVLKASKGLHARDSFSEIWGLKLKAAKEQWPITTLTGSLPLTYESRIEHVLKNYALYGSASGSGTNEYNLCDLPTFSATWATTSTTLRDSVNALTPGTYTFSCKFKVTSRNDTSDASVCGFTLISSVAGQNILIRKFVGDADVGDIVPFKGTFTLTSQNADTYTAAYVYGCGIEGIGTTGSAQCMETVLNAGTDALPYGYKIPLTLTSGEQSTDIPLYIGSTKLGAEEYVDFGEQKVYKRTENLFDKNDTSLQLPNCIFFSGNYTNSNTTSYTPCFVIFIPVTGGRTYTCSLSRNPSSGNVTFASVFSISKPSFGVSYRINDATTFVNHGTFAKKFTREAPAEANWMAVQITTAGHLDYDIMIVEGSTAPAQYIPYYQPTDPPVPFPAITAYKGENTLSSTETVGEVEITGEIKSI